jgi:hypothetical protein
MSSLLPSLHYKNSLRFKTRFATSHSNVFVGLVILSLSFLWILSCMTVKRHCKTMMVMRENVSRKVRTSSLPTIPEGHTVQPRSKTNYHFLDSECVYHRWLLIVSSTLTLYSCVVSFHYVIGVIQFPWGLVWVRVGVLSQRVYEYGASGDQTQPCLVVRSTVVQRQKIIIIWC